MTAADWSGPLSPETPFPAAPPCDCVTDEGEWCRWCDPELAAYWNAGDADACEHECETGIDQNDEPDKVWRCDACGELSRYVDDPDGRITISSFSCGSRQVRREVVVRSAEARNET